MELTLKVIRFSNRPPDRPLSHTWTEQGGTLGRSAGNDWVLPDTQRFLSGQHARIEYREGRLFSVTPAPMASSSTKARRRWGKTIRRSCRQATGSGSACMSWKWNWRRPDQRTRRMPPQ
ncbi:MAG: FHA domain-containing protein [Candidatus Thiothrix singaporensis]|uniref:FHA domain-containing protein n=1 Tax=Candidatus Thiothrix singaporensis TaxID=2799669 RepID=A0A7L6AX37_9GAMM|nr:MAG: FHA domain-containing protein [Candidatus Thiothrix singaporensis]